MSPTGASTVVNRGDRLGIWASAPFTDARRARACSSGKWRGRTAGSREGRLSESSCEHLKIVSSLHAADTPLMTTAVSGVISEHRAKALESRQCAQCSCSRSSDIVIAHTTLIEAHPTVPGTNARSKCPGAARIVRKKEDVRPPEPNTSTRSLGGSGSIKGRSDARDNVSKVSFILSQKLYRVGHSLKPAGPLLSLIT
jgi:hypothetical protein